MKSIQYTFDDLQRRNPYWGSYVVFAETVKITQPNYRILKNWFNKLVDKADYLSSEKTQLLTHLKSLITPCAMYETSSQMAFLPSQKQKEGVATL